MFKRQLKDVRCCDGDSVRLECHVVATPEPTVNVYKRKLMVHKIFTKCSLKQTKNRTDYMGKGWKKVVTDTCRLQHNI